MKLLGLDLGERRIGLAVAVWEAGKGFALPAGFVERTTLKRDVTRILEAAAERAAVGIVAGVPYNTNGSAGPQAQQALRFVKALRRATVLPVHIVDESHTTQGAEALLRQAGRQPSRRRGDADAAAAALILERFLSQTPSIADLS